MSTIVDLVTGPPTSAIGELPEVDVFRDRDALREAALLDIRADILSASAWFLFDLKGALHLRSGNTAVMVLRGVEELRLIRILRRERRWYPVISWCPRPRCASGCLLEFSMLQDSDVTAVFQRGECYIGNVPGADEAPPDYTDTALDDHAIRSGLQGWNSRFIPRQFCRI